MAKPTKDNRQDSFDDVVCRFVEARLRGDNPRVEDFLDKVPGREQEFREEIGNCSEVDTLFHSLRRIDADEFGDDLATDMIGKTIGTFEISEVIGSGGMGVVWKGRDTRLDRVVAIKALPSSLPHDPTWRQRFKREATVLASLNHPSIGAIYDVVEQSDGTDFLILEYVPGKTLAERMQGGSLPLKDSLAFASLIAYALAAACDKGIVHRDLKPRNIKITPDGSVKVLDFGIAKSLQPGDHPAELTQQGRLIGTPAYMSPEQARGKPIDHRTDVWSFGCVLYEMLAGKLAFKGETVTDTIAHVLEREPDWTQLSEAVPQNIRVLLRRCLEKDVHHRLQHIGDAALEISETLNPPPIAAPVISTSEKIRSVLMPKLVAVLLVGLAIGIVLTSLISGVRDGQNAGRPPARTHFIVQRNTSYADESLWFPSLAFSADGRTLAYVAEGADGRRRVYLRDMGDTESVVLEGTEGAVCPFFSPDGRWIGYADHFAHKVKKVSIDGGVPVVLADCMDFRGGTWSKDDQIIFSSDKGASLFSVSASGAGLKQLVAADPNSREKCTWPQMMPNGRQVLFSRFADAEHGGPSVQMLDLKTGHPDVVLNGGYYARYSSAGYLFYSSEWTLYALRFDLDNLRVEGSPVTVASRVWRSSIGTAQFAISQNGAIAYIPGTWPTKKLVPVWVDAQGNHTSLPIPARNYHQAAVSSDGTMLAFCAYIYNDPDIWVHDVAHASTSRLTHDGKSICPVWTGAKTDELVFLKTDGGLYRWCKDQNEPSLMGSVRRLRLINDWSHDGTRLCITSTDPNKPLTDLNISVLAIGAQSEFVPEQFDRSDDNQRSGVFSPDDRWIAYSSAESGRQEIYVKQYPGPGPRVLVSPDGGFQPLWSHDGQTLYYRRAGKMIAAQVETEPAFRVLETTELFDDEYYSCYRCRSYDLAPDGRFLMLHDDQPQDHRQIHVVLNWHRDPPPAE